MDKLQTGVLMLFVLLNPASATDSYFAEPIICYFLDGFLIVYCLIVTAFFFREKISQISSEPVGKPEVNEPVYQELEKLDNPDPYQVLEPTKRKKKAGKKKKSESAQPEEDKDPYESLTSTSPRPPQTPR
ncbi:T-cell surface glycoprotein CD3 zeta chain-like [Echeneis naucrates]|uniref:T-cell surface glycoprotein CD3 zeta chain-like n=1 Tax=Echeneis naucrates TaxID=173247 RepID=A0A665WTD2_ECHNA|nr:T-cell surface glycoprotein CD3 zeta chain-like [Echeneis naucrates]